MGETEDLEAPLPDTAVIDVDERSLSALANEAARNNTPVITWFYAPWCKQCKIAREGFEAAAKADISANAIFARLDCVKYPAAKKYYGVSSYPAFKVLRGPRHRWIEIGRERSEATLTTAVAKELIGPYTRVDDIGALRTALF